MGGGRILTAGVTGIEVCFGYRSRRLARDVDNDTRATLVRGSGQRLPPTWRGLRRLPAGALAAAAQGAEAGRWPPPPPRRGGHPGADGGTGKEWGGGEG